MRFQYLFYSFNLPLRKYLTFMWVLLITSVLCYHRFSRKAIKTGG
nr:MAG TPA: hypothetical protein [Caudoviricetes sp.]